MSRNRNTNKQIFLCADSSLCQNLEQIGISEESFKASNAALFSSAEDVLASIEQHYPDGLSACLWVIGSDDLSALNTACGIKTIHPELEVTLFAPEIDEYTIKRAHAGHVESVLALSEIASLFAPFQQSVDKQQAGHALIFPIVSGSGGCGKSTLCSLLSAFCASAGIKTLCIDGDLQFGDMSYAFDMPESPKIDTIAAHRNLISELGNGIDTPALINTLTYPETAEESIDDLEDLIQETSSLYDVIFINTGSFWTEEHAILFDHATKVLFVIDQRPSSLRSCQRALDLCSRCNIPTSPFLFLINHVEKGQIYSASDITRALRGLPAREIREGGVHIEEMFTQGKICELTKERTPFTTSLINLLIELMPGHSSKFTSVATGTSSGTKTWGIFKKNSEGGR